MAAWVDAERRRFEALRGQVVVGWHGVELAILAGDAGDGPGAEPPSFTHPSVPARQLDRLTVELAGATVELATTQDDDVWHLVLVAPHADASASRIHRHRVLTELPIGPIADVAVRVEDGVLAEVVLVVGGGRVLVVAGEVHEHEAERVSFVRYDESLLVFTDPDAADQIAWRPRRA